MTLCEAGGLATIEERADDARDRPQADASPCVLVVDDFAVERRIAGHLVKGVGGLRPIYASNGEEALRLIAERQPAAVLTDLQMPGMDGLELVQRIRERYPRVPVILMTAFGSEQIAIGALRAGASNYVPKRDLAEELPATLRNLVDLAAADRTRRQRIDCLQARTAHYELDNDPDLLPPLIELILENLRRIRFGDDTTRIRLGVALQEALANALYHGNLEVSSDLRQEDERRFHELARQRRFQHPYLDRKIRVSTSMDIEAARFEIADQGPGFDTARVNKPIEPEDLLRVSGRGLLLIRTFADVVWHNPRGNQVTMVKFASAPGTARA